MNKKLIITHPGGAHFDEMTAVGLIAAVNAGSEFRIERREASPAELDDAAVWVVDTGGRYEPEKRNFDHHQSLDYPAAFVLVAQYLGLLETLSVMTWWDFKDSVDRIGLVRSSVKYQAGDYLVNVNPVENWLLTGSRQNPRLPYRC